MTIGRGVGHFNEWNCVKHSIRDLWILLFESFSLGEGILDWQWKFLRSNFELT